MSAAVRDRVDAVVAGSGIAGLVAAATLVERGLSVLLVEKAPRLGGSTRMSGGTIWTAASMTSMSQLVPGGERERQRHLVEGIEAGLDWLEDQGVEVAERNRTSERVVAQVDPYELIDRLAATVTAGGATIAAATALREVQVDEVGAVRAAVLSSEGTTWRISTSAVVLATGGFQADPVLRSRYLVGHSRELMLRASPDSTGDALRIARSLSARTSPDMASFYGHTMPRTDAPIAPERWTSVTPYYTQDAVLIDVTGARFFDESSSMADERAPMALVQQPGAWGALILDDALYGDEDLPARSRARVGTSFDAAVAAEARHAVAGSLADLGDELAAWGVDRDRLLATLRDYNHAVRAGRGAELSPPRRRHQIAVERPPFRALAVIPAITFTLGGIDVDVRYRVRGGDGAPIPGLFAIGADAGGTYEGGYAGGLCLGLVQGRRLGEVFAIAGHRP